MRWVCVRPPLGRSHGARARPRVSALRTLIIDNYDSYTYNLYQLVADVNGGAPPLVVRNDATSVAEIRGWLAEGRVHNIVVSPGPGTPERADDVGVVLDVLRAFSDVPILGVCLGHQALATAYGGRVVRAPEPVHGRLSAIQHDGHALLDGIPSGRGFEVVRYHSLVVEEASLPPCLQPICWAAGGHAALSLHGDTGARPTGGDSQRLVMGLAHVRHPHVGVQFHPESIATAYGAQLLRNFARMTAQRCPHAPRLPAPLLAPQRPATDAAEPPWIEGGDSPALRLAWAQLPHPAGVAPEQLLAHVSGGAAVPGSGTWWLDSADAERGRFSFLGARGGPLWRRFTFQLPPPDAQLPSAQAWRLNGAAAGLPDDSGAAERTGCCSSSSSAACECECGGAQRPLGVLTEMDAAGETSTSRCAFFEWLDGFLGRTRVARDAGLAASLPFDFWGGLVGYLGYEMKAECGASNAHASK